MTGELTEADRRILRRYGALERNAEDYTIHTVDEEMDPVVVDRYGLELAAQMDFFRRFSSNWKPGVRVRPQTLVAMQDAASSSTSVRGMNEPPPPLLNRAARRAMRKAKG